MLDERQLELWRGGEVDYYRTTKKSLKDFLYSLYSQATVEYLNDRKDKSDGSLTMSREIDKRLPECYFRAANIAIDRGLPVREMEMEIRKAFLIG